MERAFVSLMAQRSFPLCPANIVYKRGEKYHMTPNMKNLIHKISPPCAKCLYRLGMVQTLGRVHIRASTARAK